MKKPNKIEEFMYIVMKEACRFSFADLLEEYGITESEYEEIEKWFKDQGITL